MLRSIELDIARRLSFSNQQRAFTRWVAGFAALGMALGVASLIVVLSVMNFHRSRINVRFEGVICVRQCRKFKSHGIMIYLLLSSCKDN